jgi:hypothetical protein
MTSKQSKRREVGGRVLSIVLFVALMLATVPSAIAGVSPLIALLGLPLAFHWIVSGLCVFYTWSFIYVVHWGALRTFSYKRLGCTPPDDDIADLEKIKQNLARAREERSQLLAEARRLNIHIIDELQNPITAETVVRRSAHRRKGTMSKIRDFIIMLLSVALFCVSGVMMLVGPLVAIFQAIPGAKNFLLFLWNSSWLRLPVSVVPILSVLLAVYAQVVKLLTNGQKQWRISGMYATYFAHLLGISTSDWKEFEKQKREYRTLKANNVSYKEWLTVQKFQQYCDIRIQLLRKIQPHGRLTSLYDDLKKDEQHALQRLLPDDEEGTTQFKWDHWQDDVAVLQWLHGKEVNSFLFLPEELRKFLSEVSQQTRHTYSNPHPSTQEFWHTADKDKLQAVLMHIEILKRVIQAKRECSPTLAFPDFLYSPEWWEAQEEGDEAPTPPSSAPRASAHSGSTASPPQLIRPSISVAGSIHSATMSSAEGDPAVIADPPSLAAGYLLQPA